MATIAQKYRIGWREQPATAPGTNRALGQQLSNIDELFETLFTEVRRLAALTGAGTDGGTSAGVEWSVLTNGNVATPDLIFADGDVIMVHLP